MGSAARIPRGNSAALAPRGAGALQRRFEKLGVVRRAVASGEFAFEYPVGVPQIEDQIWRVGFLEYGLGYFDKERDRAEPGPSPFMTDKVLTMCPVNTL
jgi:hypothetical protein